jgi:hypothetical protein
MKTSKFIAFQTVDIEGDIWCNKALLFSNEEKVNEFFKDPINVITTLEYELEDRENPDTLNYDIHRSGQNEDDNINCITFNCIYAGDVKIVRMSNGYLIK